MGPSSTSGDRIADLERRVKELESEKAHLIRAMWDVHVMWLASKRTNLSLLGRISELEALHKQRR
jgi:hypothetical protein